MQDAVNIETSTDSITTDSLNDIIINQYNPLLPPNTYANNDNPN